MTTRFTFDAAMRLGIPPAFIALVLTASSVTAGPLTPVPAANRPGLGLYQIDTDSEHGFVGGGDLHTQHQNGANGDVNGTVTSSKDTPGRTFAHKGTGPVTQCIKTLSASDFNASLPMLQLAAKCKQDTKLTVDGYIHTAICPSGHSTFTAKRLSMDVWQYDTVGLSGGPSVAPSIDFMVPMLEMQAKHGATVQDREKAAKSLAAMPAMQKEMKEGRAAMFARYEKQAANAKTPAERASIEAMMAQMNGTPQIWSKVKKILTKISNQCS